MIQIPLLTSHLEQAFGTGKGFVSLITKQTIAFLSNSQNIYVPVYLDKAILLL